MTVRLNMSDVTVTSTLNGDLLIRDTKGRELVEVYNDALSRQARPLRNDVALPLVFDDVEAM